MIRRSSLIQHCFIVAKQDDPYGRGYLDTAGIISLRAQISDLMLRSLAITNELGRETGGSIKPKLGLGAALRWVGFPSFDVEGEVSRKGTDKNTSKAEYYVAQEVMAKDIIYRLAKNNGLYRDAYAAWCAAQAISGSVFCYIEGQFSPIGWRHEADDWRTYANKQGTLVLRDVNEPSLLVGMALSKIVGLHGGSISETCHLALRLRNGYIRLRVFGKMDKTKYIKPFLVTYK